MVTAPQFIDFRRSSESYAKRTALHRDAALSFLKKGAPGSGILNTMADRMTERKYDVNFLLRLMT